MNRQRSMAPIQTFGETPRDMLIEQKLEHLATSLHALN